MTTTDTILEICKYCIPAIIVLVLTYLIVNKFLVSDYQKKQLAIFEEHQNATTQLRLQAYERLAIFVERMHPRNLIPRIYTTGMTVSDLQTLCTMSIREEFEHNLSQQIYVSAEVWKTVVGVKEQELNMINLCARELDPNADAKMLNNKIVDYVSQQEDATPNEIALDVINHEAKLVMYQKA